MPKRITEREREQTQKAIIKATAQLIRAQKGIKNITVDDIIKVIGTGKSSFYAHFKSKEECIYEVYKNAVIHLYNQFESIMLTKRPRNENLVRYLRDYYLAEDNVANCISPNEMENLMRKLPPEYSEREQELSEGVITNTMKLLNLNILQVETLTVMLDCMDHVFTNNEIPKPVKEEALKTLIQSISDYVENNSKENKQCGI